MTKSIYQDEQGYRYFCDECPRQPVRKELTVEEKLQKEVEANPFQFYVNKRYIHTPNLNNSTKNETLSRQFIQKYFGHELYRKFDFALFSKHIQYRPFDSMGYTNEFFLFETDEEAEKALLIWNEFLSTGDYPRIA